MHNISFFLQRDQVGNLTNILPCKDNDECVSQTFSNISTKLIDSLTQIMSVKKLCWNNNHCIAIFWQTEHIQNNIFFQLRLQLRAILILVILWIFSIFCPLKCKGQLISKCPYEKSVLSKIPTKIFLDFCPEFFYSFLEASW